MLKITEDDLCYSTTKLFHAYGLGNGLSFPLSAGADHRARARAVQARTASSRPSRATRPTLFFSVPALYAAMLKAPALAETDFSSIRACISAAEPLPAGVSERWQAQTGVPILDGIGSTEMLHIYCSNTLEDLRPGTSGTPVPGYELRVSTSAGRTPRPERPATCWCAARAAPPSTGTSARRHATACAASGSTPATATSRPPTGHFVYQGRADDMIKVGGLWVAPADVEACLIRHPAVSEAAVIGVTVDDVSRIKAFVICAEEPAEPDALADELRRVVQGAPAPLRVPPRGRLRRGLPAHRDGQDPALQAPRGRGEAAVQPA